MQKESYYKCIEKNKDKKNFLVLSRIVGAAVKVFDGLDDAEDATEN